MSLHEQSSKDKGYAIAMVLVAKSCAEAAGVVELPPLNVAQLCKDNEVSRVGVYEKQNRIQTLHQNAPAFVQGRPPSLPEAEKPKTSSDLEGAELRAAALQYQLDHPGSVVSNPKGRRTYSIHYKTFILSLQQNFSGTDDELCKIVDISTSSLWDWREEIKRLEAPPARNERQARWPEGVTPSTEAKLVAELFEKWEGSRKGFYREIYRSRRHPTHVVKIVLRVCGLVRLEPPVLPPYREATLLASPGTIFITDGTELNIRCLTTGMRMKLNWQGIVDQATGCHLAVVITKRETAEAIREAYRRAVEFVGREPEACIHDNKKPYFEKDLQKDLGHKLVAVTAWRPQNKAMQEGAFGVFELSVGVIEVPDIRKWDHVHTIVTQLIRMHTETRAHTGRVELDGKSPTQALREACPDPVRDRRVVSTLRARHPRPPQGKFWGCRKKSKALLDEVFKEWRCPDPSHRVRNFCASQFSFEAVRRGIQVVRAEKKMGRRLSGEDKMRYLVSTISRIQVQYRLETQSRTMLGYAHDGGGTRKLEEERAALLAQGLDAQSLALAYTEKLTSSHPFVEREFWEMELHLLMASKPEVRAAVLDRVTKSKQLRSWDRCRLLQRLTNMDVCADDYAHTPVKRLS